MAIKNIIAKGVGFSPGDTHYIVTHGFDIGTAPPPGTDVTPIAAFGHVVGNCLILITTAIWRFAWPHPQ